MPLLVLVLDFLGQCDMSKAQHQVHQPLVGTGLRRGDLGRLAWDAVGEHAIIARTGKSRGKTAITNPLPPETRLLIERIEARHAAEMAQRPASRRKPLPPTVLSNGRRESWTPGGFGSRFNDAKQAGGLDRHLHDLRETFATRCMIAGLTDDEIAKILGWDIKDVAVIREKYVNDASVVIAIGERISAAKTA